MRGWTGHRVYNKQGELVSEFHDHNMIVAVAKDAVCRLIGGDVTGKSITKIAFGTNGTAEASTDIAITGGTEKAVSSVSYGTGYVEFECTLGFTEGNGLAIAERGLVTANGTLFARKAHPVINKTSSDQIVFYWRINF